MQDYSNIHQSREYVFGSDPEVFSRDSKGQIVPAFKFLPPKTDPLLVELPNASLCYHIYNDGFQAELRANPHGCVAYVVDSIRGGLKAIWERSNGAHLVLDNAPMIPIEVLRETPDEHVILGCDPSQNAYYIGGKVVGDPRLLRYRFTGFHIHVSGWHLDKDIEKRQKFLLPYVKLADAILGVYFVAAGAHLESTKRREYYGLAGEYRLPEHGLEYRVLSSTVLSHPGVCNLAFEMMRGVLAIVDSAAEKLWVADEEEVIGIINENNQQAARALLKRNKELLREVVSFGRFGKLYHGNSWYDSTYKMGLEGIDAFVKDPTDFITNWKFNRQWTGHAESNDEGWIGLCQR